MILRFKDQTNFFKKSQTSTNQQIRIKSQKMISKLEWPVFVYKEVNHLTWKLRKCSRFLFLKDNKILCMAQCKSSCKVFNSNRTIQIK